MVDLPKVPRRLVTTEAPRSRVSAEAIGAPFAMLGNALGQLGEGVEAAGVRIAEDEGRRAVTTGEDGMPKFEPMPAFTGRAGEMYNRVGTAKWAVEMQNATEDAVMKARLDHRGDPEKFKEWASGYVEKLVANEPDEKLKEILKAQAGRSVKQAYDTLSIERQNIDISTTATSLKERQALLERRMLSLIQSGIPADSPDYAALLADRDAIKNERIKNPLFRYTAQQAALEDQNFETQSVALGLVGAVRRTAASNAEDGEGKPLGGLKKAQAIADSILTDPRLNDLSLEQRHHFYRLAIAETKALSTEDRLLVNQLNGEGQTLRRAIEKGDVDPETVRDYLQRSGEARAVRGWSAVTNAVALNSQLRGWFDRLPPDERVRVQQSLEGKLGSLSDRIIRAESGGNPFAQATTSTAAGAGQFIERTWLTLLQRYRPDLVNSAETREELLALRNNPDLAREMVLRSSEENRDVLAKAGVRTDDGALYLAHFLGAGDATKILLAHSTKPLSEILSPQVIDANSSVFRDVKTAGDLTVWAARKVNLPEVPAAVQTNPAFLNAVRTRQKQELDAVFPNIEKRIRQTETISDDELEQFGALVFSVGTDEQKRKALDLAVLVRAGAAYSTMSAQQRSNLTLEFSRMFASGSARLESEVGTYARQLNQTISGDYQRDPYDAAVRYGKRKPVPVLDFSNPQALSAALRVRVNEQDWIKQQEGVGPFSLLRPAEAEALRAQLTHGDTAQAEAVLSVINQVANPEAVTATLASEPIKAALNGMILTGDTRRMTAAFTTLDRLWQSNPQQFEASFGKDTFNKLAIWQSNLSYRKPEEIAELLRRAEDPQYRTVREKLLTTYTEEANKLSESELLGHFSRRFLGITLSAAQPAASPVQMQVFRQEFAGIYATLRADGVDQTNATERAIKWVSQAWGVSPSNGNRLMRRPPENYLPQVNGSHGWAADEVRREIEAVLGPQFSPVVGGLKRQGGKTYLERPSELPGPSSMPSASLSQNWDYALVPDATTEGEIARLNRWKAANPGKTPPADLWPSYSLVVFDKEKREINLWDRGPNMATEAMPLSAPVQPRPTATPRFKWSDTALRAAETSWPEQRQQSLEKDRRKSIAREIFPAVLTAGAVPIRLRSDAQ